MIDNNKSLIIFSHPRSGSTWFQFALKHFNTSELFNLSLTYTPIPEDKSVGNYIRKYYTLNYPKHRYYETGIDHEFDDRFKIYNEIENKHNPISVKVHVFDAKDKVIDFLQTKDVNYIYFERKDKIATFWSLIISWTTLQFHNFSIKYQEISISKEGFDMVSDAMLKFESQVDKLKQIFPIKHIYYEDAINYEISEWWGRPNNPIKKQNMHKLTTIKNLDEVMSWIEEIDLFNRI